MLSQISIKLKLILILSLPPLLALFVIFFNLGEFGLWEPYEINQLDNGTLHLKNESALDSCIEHPGACLGALGWEKNEPTEKNARFFIAILAFVAILVVYFSLLAVAQPSTAFFAAIILIASPFFIFHGRQLTGAMPRLLAEIIAICGLILVPFGKNKLSLIAGTLLALLGIIAGTVWGSFLVGAALPLLTLGIPLLFTKTTNTKRLQISKFAYLALGAITLLAFAGVTMAHLIFETADVPFITGGVSQISHAKDYSYASPIHDLIFSWFPWFALVPLIIFGDFLSSGKLDPPSTITNKHLRLIALCGLPLGIVAHAIHSAYHGPSQLFLVIPIILAIATVLSDMEKATQPWRFAVFVAVVFLAIIIRDLALNPQHLLIGYGFAHLKAPSNFTPIVPTIIAIIPLLATLFIYGFFPNKQTDAKKTSTLTLKRPFRFLFGRIGVVISTLFLSVYISQVMVPELSVDLSSKHILSTYEKYATNDEPLAVLGSGLPAGGAKKLSSRESLVNWLSKDTQAFALFTPKTLAKLNRKYREKTGRHIFIVDAQSDRFFLGASKPIKNRANQNPIEAFVKKAPFAKSPRNNARVEFENKVTLLGWEITSETGKPYLEKGKEYNLTTYWRCNAQLDTDFKFFGHIDGPGPRINADHAPINDTYPTNQWVQGDYLKDVFKGSVPTYQKTGNYAIHIGFFKNQRRLKVSDPGKFIVKENSVKLGSVKLR